MLKLFRPLEQRGDTIVEVMIVLAVLGLAISVSYGAANRSLLNARQAQESARGGQLARTQLEQLRGFFNIKQSSDPNYVYRNQTFCIAAANAVQVINAGPFPPACQFDSLPYEAVIKYDDTPGKEFFTIRVTWDDVLGRDRDSASLVYRLHPEEAP